jgi:hypothetical protein
MNPSGVMPFCEVLRVCARSLGAGDFLTASVQSSVRHFTAQG